MTSAQRNDLIAAVGRAKEATSPKGSMPILAHVHLAASASGLRVRGTDLYTAVVADCPATTEQGWSCTTDAKALHDVLRRLPDGLVILDLEGDALSVKAGRARFKLPTLAAEDYPGATEVPALTEYPAEPLSALLAAVLPAVCTDDSRPHLAGVMLTVEDGTARAVCTDGHRLHVAEVELVGPALRALIPRGPAHTLAKLVDKAEGVSLAVSGPTLFARVGDVTFLTKTSDEQFPPWQKVVPKPSSLRLGLDATLFADALRRVALVAPKSAVSLLLEPGQLTLSAMSPDTGEAVEVLDVDADAAGKWGVNPGYMLDALKGRELVTVSLGHELDPVRLDDEGFTAVVMPMRLGH